ncbi:MAG: hypothetical protein Q7S45_01390 [Candidatus Curtissbacteria bacterium]|nr:hypothetical protein [Candidatus Curtissbacteria bacterium]
MVEQHFASRKTIPDCGRSSTKLANGTPDRPPVTTSTFTLDTIRRDETRIRGRQIEITQPPVPCQVVNVGGGRAIGGGTSDEAIHRWRKKGRRSA